MTFDSLCCCIAARADERLEATGWGGLIYSVESLRPWWHVALVRDEQRGPEHVPGWELQVGKWSLMKDGKGTSGTVWGSAI